MCIRDSYYAFVRGANGNWYRTNDESVSATSIENVLRQNAYVLLYQNMNLLTRKSKECEAPLAKNKNEAQKLANSMLDGLFGAKGKQERKSAPEIPLSTNPITTSRTGQIKANGNSLPQENLMKDESTKSDSVNSSSDTKSKPEIKSSAAENMLIDSAKKPNRTSIETIVKNMKLETDKNNGSKKGQKRKRSEKFVLRSGLQKMHYLVQALSKCKRPKHDEPLKASQKYFNADSEIFGWENAKRPSSREQLMVELSRPERVRQRHIIDAEYDKGKLKKVRDKKKFEGLQSEFDSIQRCKIQSF
eukprot:TRINITY_DN1779_c0_g1_i19.p1 TRINITY_DN1779_c0_g1~~TRINITY_DN1779_c0_g1_i19.p1  ORF type:complete len:303 (+),score=56.04 TRINITY_DN1779_c0_g1_i19:73-981(+)